MKILIKSANVLISPGNAVFASSHANLGVTPCIGLQVPALLTLPGLSTPNPFMPQTLN